MAAVALVAAFAIGAGTASAQFHVEAAPATITGGFPAGEESASEAEALIFTFKSSTPCVKSSYVGQMTATTQQSLTLIPTIGKCLAVSITMGKCDFVLEPGGTLDIEGGVECMFNPIEIQPGGGCRMAILPQQNLSTITYANNGSGKNRDVTVTLNITGIHYNQLSSTCFNLPKGTYTNGQLKGQITLRADHPGGGPAGLFFE